MLSEHFGCLGLGLIGGGWAARSVLFGRDVLVYEPKEAAWKAFETLVSQARTAFRAFWGADFRTEGSYQRATTLAELAAGADLIQESIPEDLSLKRSVFLELDPFLTERHLLCSSTSGFVPSCLQEGLTHPENLLVAHPFNPVYLLPLVELCASPKTPPQTVQRAALFYTDMGMTPLVLDVENDGFIADRLMEALWREALWLVAEGKATVSQLDKAVTHGFGMRMGIMGMFTTFRLAGGPGGMEHFLSQFGPALQFPWTKLEAPALTPELQGRLMHQLDQQRVDGEAAGLETELLVSKRDACLVGFLKLLEAHGLGPGPALAGFRTGTPAAPASG